MGFIWFKQVFTEFYRVLPGFTGFYRVSVNWRCFGEVFYSAFPRRRRIRRQIGRFAGLRRLTEFSFSLFPFRFRSCCCRTNFVVGFFHYRVDLLFLQCGRIWLDLLVFFLAVYHWEPISFGETFCHSHVDGLDQVFTEFYRVFTVVVSNRYAVFRAKSKAAESFRLVFFCIRFFDFCLASSVAMATVAPAPKKNSVNSVNPATATARSGRTDRPAFVFFCAMFFFCVLKKRKKKKKKVNSYSFLLCLEESSSMATHFSLRSCWCVALAFLASASFLHLKNYSVKLGKTR